MIPELQDIDNFGFDKFCFTSPGMFSLEGQPGCKWLYIDRRGESHRHGQAKACKSALGENPVMMNDVCMSERV